jgi:rhamnopyranosyl-N-acetylglucosaminyl-diphospho-decaprenol beta-1,3/1,4-galactofuranosyltransferase
MLLFVPEETRPDATLRAVVVTFRRLATLQATLDAVFEQSKPPDTLLVVDNAADPEVRDSLARFPQAEYVASAENIGPAGAIAAGMERTIARCGPHDWILLIDDDDPPPIADALERLWAAARSAPNDVGAIGLTGARFNTRSARLDRVLDENLVELTDVDYIGNGQLPLYRALAIQDVGVFQPELFFGFEELEYGLRLRGAGWRVVTSGELTREVRKLHGRSGLGRHARSGTEPYQSWRRYYSMRNLLTITRRHGSPLTPLTLTARGIASGLLSVLRSRRLSAGTPSWKGLVDGWSGRLGRTVEPGADVMWRKRAT